MPSPWSSSRDAFPEVSRLLIERAHEELVAGNLDDMEKFGIYEVLPEDLATCEFVDPSKNDIQAIIECGIDRMIKEMA